MKLFSGKMSTGQLLLQAYVIIWLPGLYASWETYSAIDRQIVSLQQVQTTAEIAAPDAALADLPLLHRLARAWRMRSADYQPESAAVQMMRDIKLVFVVSLAVIFILGCLMIWYLSLRLYQPIEKIGKNITRLSGGRTSEPIEIAGARQVQKVAEELEKLRNHMNESEKQQVHFLRHISHEIKTPLTSIKEGAQLLEDEIVGPVTEDQREITQILSKSSKELQTSIENLLNYNSAITVKKIKQREVVNLTELVVDVLEKHALTIKSKRIKIESSLPNQRAFIDREQIRTVFDNLLSNAIKFSPLNGTIWLLMEKRDGSVLFTVKDQGPGIKKKQQGAIFDAFFIGDSPNTGPLKGTGLGLSIARQYVEAHQGQIKLLDTPKGALFEVWLPA
ncbi:MAG: HAMP domain-containing histidine kinase [Gammaproteobacteria bacterium]|nr:HAMP domain-containing histidine kinase [Gammaproteobacteria bacterium]